MLKKIIQKIKEFVNPQKVEDEQGILELEPVKRGIESAYWKRTLKKHTTYISECMKFKGELARLDGKMKNTRKYRTKKKLLARISDTQLKYAMHLLKSW